MRSAGTAQAPMLSMLSGTMWKATTEIAAARPKVLSGPIQFALWRGTNANSVPKRTLTTMVRTASPMEEGLFDSSGQPSKGRTRVNRPERCFRQGGGRSQAAR